MQDFLLILKDAFLDTLKMSWLLLLFYIIIELVEQKVAVKMHKQLKSKYAVLAGAGFGIIPQCGFSVLASDLYSKKQITIGTLIAVYIATSDEALPILFSSLDEEGVWLKLLMLILSKLVIALIAGYVLDAIMHAAGKKRTEHKVLEVAPAEHGHSHCEHEHEGHDDRKAVADLKADAVDDVKTAQVCCNIQEVSQSAEKDEERCEDGHDHSHEDGHAHCEDDHEHCDDDHKDEVDIHKGCCGHRIESGKYSTVKTYFVHPLLHTLKILAYILVINIIMGLVIHFVGEENIAEFMTKSGVLQPILVTIVGLIPNCASSVLITELFLSGTISFGSSLGGLIVNAGLGIAFLFKENKKIKENLAITFGLFGFALVIAIVFHYAFMNIL